MKRWLFISGMIFTGAINIFPQGKNKIIDLRGEWKFSIGGNETWAGYWFDDAKWEIIKTPSPWENQGFYGYNGFAFYRKDINIPSRYKGFMFYLNLGYIDDVDEVFFNGELIGSTGSFPPNYTSAYNAKREYYIPETLIKFGQKNVIAVKIYDSQAEGGIVKGDIGIYVSGMPINLDINLQGRWKFRTGDNPSYKEPGYNDAGWDKIFVPSYWENQGFRDYDGYAWYRINVNYNDQIKDDKVILMLGKIDDNDQVFVNGEFVGSTGSFNGGNSRNTFDALRGYYFSEGILKNGTNTIAVRILDFRSGGGIYEGPIGIISQKKYIEFWRNKKEYD